MYSTTKILRGYRVTASYREPDQVIYQHNPYIASLPGFMEEAEYFTRIARYPAYDPDDRKKPALFRQEAVQTLDHLTIPLPVHDDLAKRLSRIIRSGYFARNPIDSEYAKQMRAAFPTLDYGEMDSSVPIIRNNPSGFAVIGVSGAGKTTGIESCLLELPQVIVHTQYNGQPFDQTQVVWLKLECPHDGSLKGICINFIQAVNQLLGKDTPITKYIRMSKDPLMEIMSGLAFELGLGVLVIDEIQRLKEAKADDCQKMLNFFVELQNKIGVPMVFVGTFRVIPVLQQSFANVRRASGQGDLIWYPIAQDEEWDHFVRKLWRYQWTKHETPLSPQLSRVLHEETQGIIDIAIKLYKIVQWMLIDDDNQDELITPELIRRAAAEHLVLARPILLKLKEKDYDFLQTLVDDLPSMTDKVSDYFESVRNEAARKAALARLNENEKAQVERLKKSKGDELRERLVHVLEMAGYGSDVARQCSNQIIERHGEQVDIPGACRAALALAAGMPVEVATPGTASASTKTRRSRRRSTGNSAGGDETQAVLPDGILAAIRDGKERRLGAHAALKRAGIIDNLDRYLM